VRALLADRLERRLHEAVVVDVLDDARAGGAEAGVVDLGEAPLLEELVDEARAARGGVGHGVHLRVALAVVAGRATGVAVGVPLLAVLALEPAQALELGRPAALRGLLAVALAAGVGVVRRAGHHELEGDVLLDLLLEALLELHRVQLQDLRRLDELRRQTHGLAELHALRCLEAHPCHWRFLSARILRAVGR